MGVTKINYPNLIVKTKEKQEARSARVKQVFTMVYRDHIKLSLWGRSNRAMIGRVL